MRYIHLIGLFLLLAFNASLHPLHAQAQALPPAAYVTSDGLHITLADGSQTLIAGAPNSFTNLRWHPAGRDLLYTYYGATIQTVIFDTLNGESRVVVEDSAFFPSTFSHLGDKVIYGDVSAAVNDSPTGPMLDVTLYEQYVDGSEEALVIGTVQFGVGCGGGSLFPMDSIYNSEVGFGGRNLTFTDTAFGLVYSTNCTGQGLALLRDGTSTLIGETLSRASVSPAGTHLAAFDETDGTVRVVNLFDGSETRLQPSQRVDQLIWRATNDALIYSTRDLMPDALPLSNDEAAIVATVLGLPADGIPQFEVSVRQLTLTGEESVLMSEPAWAIGRMSAQLGVLYISVIPNGEGWVEALANGTLDLYSPDSALQAWRSVGVSNLRLMETGGTLEQIGSNAHQLSPRP